MVLSTRRAVLLVALVGVLALGIMGLLRAVSASPESADKHNGSEERTLTVLTKTREIKVLDLGPKGPSQGDLRAINAPVYNATGKEKVGRVDSFCVVTDPADEPNEKAHMAECTYTYTLPGGEISGQGVIAYPKLPKIPTRGVDAITGGTGKYAGVRGERRFETPGTKVIITFHFIG
jgi:hypothetical protein